MGRVGTYGDQQKRKKIGHHAGPRRASATTPLRTGAHRAIAAGFIGLNVNVNNLLAISI